MSERSFGFTLIEVLFATAIAGLVLTILAESLRFGMAGTDSYRRNVKLQTDMVPIERALRGMIERMSPGRYPDPPLMQGAAHAVVFATELPDPATGGSLTADVRLDVENRSLVLSWTPHARGIPFVAPPPPVRTVLLDQVARLDISYAAKGADTAWLSDWTAPALPGLVRLRIVPATGDAWPAIVVRPQREQAEE